MTAIDLPIANDSITNKPASQKQSLYHTCRYVLDGLSTIHALQPYLTTDTAMTPMSRLWHFCRQGTSLCILFNTLRPGTPILLETSPANAHKPKAYAYHFMVACQDQLHFSSDSLFTPNDIFQDDTNGFVRVVNVLKRVVEMMETQGIIIIPSSLHEVDADAPKDTRDKIVIELLETERKYVQDLETLQNYMKQAKSQEVLPPDTLHQLFGNLNAMVDCQRKFLVQVEEQAVKSPQDQRFGQLFLEHEEPFTVYEPFCANFQTAQSLVLREMQALEQLAHVLTPSFELPSILIKPVQRICKYPLLMKQLVKSTPSHWPFHDETKQGLDAIQRVAAKVNETKRRQENLVTVQDLKNRVDDWPASDIDDFGPLLLHDKFMVYRGDPGRELIVYLFEKCLFVCREEKEKDANKQEHGKKGQKRNKKSNGSSSSSNNNSNGNGSGSSSADGNSPPASDRLGVRGRILMSRVAQVNDTSQDGAWSLRIFWSEKYLQPGQQFRLDSFTLKCRHQEQLQLWESSLNRLIAQMKQQAREAKQSAQAAQLAAAQATSRLDAVMHDAHRNKIGIHDDDDDNDDEEEDAEVDEEEHGGDMNNSNHDVNGEAVSNEYYYSGVNQGDEHRHNSPLPRQHLYNATALGMTLPPLPRPMESPPISYPSSPTTRVSSANNLTRFTSNSSNNSATHIDEHHLLDYQHQHHHLHSVPATELITRHMLSEQHTDDHDDDFDDDYDTYSSAMNTPQTPLSFSLSSHQQHQQNRPDKPLPDILAADASRNIMSTTRLRSQSSPNIHPSSSQNDIAAMPQVPIAYQHLSHHPQHRYDHQHLPTSYHHRHQDTSRLDKRRSNGDQDLRRPLYSFDTTIMQDNGASSSLSASATATKIKVHHLGSIYVLVVPLTIDYKDLVERIERKMKCDSTTISTSSLTLTGLKYQDEEGDLITIKSNEDLQMGFELRGLNNTVNFYIV